MTDKDLMERDAIKNSLLPLKVNLIICAYYTLRTLNHEITTEKRKITPTERDEAKKILRKLVYAEIEENYQKLYEKFKTLPQSIVDYLCQQISMKVGKSGHCHRIILITIF